MSVDLTRIVWDSQGVHSLARELWPSIERSVLLGNIGRSELLVLLAYAFRANTDGEAWPSDTRLSLMTRLSQRQVTRLRKRLEQRGLILRIGTTTNGVIKYRVLPPEDLMRADDWLELIKDSLACGEARCPCGRHPSRVTHCPAHEDKNPSLSYMVNEAGMPLVHCLAGCLQTEVIWELQQRDLWRAQLVAA